MEPARELRNETLGELERAAVEPEINGHRYHKAEQTGISKLTKWHVWEYFHSTWRSGSRLTTGKMESR
jgi:hypothetical protein